MSTYLPRFFSSIPLQRHQYYLGARALRKKINIHSGTRDLNLKPELQKSKRPKQTFIQAE